jgi:hypothetical protein
MKKIPKIESIYETSLASKCVLEPVRFESKSLVPLAYIPTIRNQMMKELRSTHNLMDSIRLEIKNG